jgi:hypothetical protein
MDNTIKVEFPVSDWIWLCEFLSEVIKLGELEPYVEEDTQRLLDLLNSVTR